jgi:hypothetical protein
MQHLPKRIARIAFIACTLPLLCACAIGDRLVQVSGSIGGPAAGEHCLLVLRTEAGGVEVNRHEIPNVFRRDFLLEKDEGRYVATVECPGYQPVRRSVELRGTKTRVSFGEIEPVR